MALSKSQLNQRRDALQFAMITRRRQQIARLEEEIKQARQKLDKARAEEEWLRDAVEQLDALAPQAGEEAHLTSQREMLSNVGRIGEGLAMADDAILGEDGAQTLLGKARAALERVALLAAGGLDQALTALERADAELTEASMARPLALVSSKYRDSRNCCN